MLLKPPVPKSKTNEKCFKNKFTIKAGLILNINYVAIAIVLVCLRCILQKYYTFNNKYSQSYLLLFMCGFLRVVVDLKQGCQFLNLNGAK